MENISSKCLAVCTLIPFLSSLKICCIRPAKIVCTFEKRYKNKCQQLWQHHELCIFCQFLFFSLTLETFSMPVTVRPDFVASWTDSVPVRNFFLHLRAVYKDTLLTHKLTSHNWVKVSITKWEMYMRFLFINFNVFNDLDQVPNHFYIIVVNSWLKWLHV